MPKNHNALIFFKNNENKDKHSSKLLLFDLIIINKIDIHYQLSLWHRS